MRCKVGDLAVVVVGKKSSGRIVRCLGLVSGGDAVTSKCGYTVRVEVDRPVWHVEGFIWSSMCDFVSREWPVAADNELRPIRDQPGQDETLTWSPVPNKVPA